MNARRRIPNRFFPDQGTSDPVVLDGTATGSGPGPFEVARIPIPTSCAVLFSVDMLGAEHAPGVRTEGLRGQVTVRRDGSAAPVVVDQAWQFGSVWLLVATVDGNDVVFNASAQVPAPPVQGSSWTWRVSAFATRLD